MRALGHRRLDDALDYLEHLRERPVWRHTPPQVNKGKVMVTAYEPTTKVSAGHRHGRYGKGGDFLYRWGNPANCDRGTAADQRLAFQQGARWRKAIDEYGYRIAPQAARDGPKSASRRGSLRGRLLFMAARIQETAPGIRIPLK